MGISDRTAETQPADAPDAALGGRLGRYAIEAPLGRGGLGVVYLAYDPELQRRVALKVLRAGDADSHARLLREARAMARLRHPNVVTVYDVGTVDDRDYVTMELMDGGTLEAWLATPRSPGDIAAAFVACGRGLVAAHAAGLVHRDVKPANILRAADGRVALTDFGLARDHDAAREVVEGPRLRRPSAVTATGLVLGTPAYMPPEQWSGETTQASDQFAFCVSLFEALAGARPYAGADDTTLIEAVERGPAGIDAQALRAVPRRFRRLLVRGLEPEPARRWPSMAVLVDQLARARRRPRVVAATAAASAALVAIVGASTYVGTTQAPVAACRRPQPALAEVWNPAIAAQLRAHGSAYAPLAAVLDDDAAAWDAARARACDEPGQVQEPRLACLDGVAARAGMIGDVAVHGGADATNVDRLVAMLVDPGVCVRDDRLPPRLVAAWSPAARVAFAAFAMQRQQFGDGSAAPAAPRSDDACQTAFALVRDGARNLDFPNPDALAQAVQSAALCGDDRLVADTLLQQLKYMWPHAVERPEIEARARRAIEHVDEDKLDAFFHTWGVGIDEEYEHRVDIAACEHDIATFRRSHLEVSAAATTTKLYAARLDRHQLGDVAAVADGVPGLLATAAGITTLMPDVHAIAAEARWDLGDLAGAHAEMAAAAVLDGYAGTATTGIVVDRAGHPVAGARVVAAFQDVIADRSMVGLTIAHDPRPSAVVTDRDGQFSLSVLPPVVVAAETAGGASRSRALAAATTGNRLVVEPTRRIAGRIVSVDVAGMRRPLVIAHAADDDGLAVYGTLDRDGGFELAGVPDRPVDVVAVDGFDHPTSTIARVDRGGDVAGVELRVAFPTRKLDVTVRSASVALLQAAYVYVVEPGGEPPRSYAGVVRRHRYWMKESSSDASHKVVVHFAGLPDGAVMACVNADFGDVQEMSTELAVACVAVPAGSDAATIEVTPPAGSAAR